MREKYVFANAKKNQYIKSEITKFQNIHRDKKFSAAKFEYSIYLDWEESKK